MKEEIVAVKTEAKRTTRLRRLLANPKILVAPGAYDGTGARLVQALGFQAIYMSGFETSASILGEPDVGYLTMTQMTARLATLSAIVDLPLIADGDTGYGNPLNVRRAVREYERAGAAAMHIEDQTFPKRCGQMPGRDIIPTDEMVQKIKAAVDARQDPDFVIIARTDAISAVGLDEALRRGEAAAEAGADVLFIEAPRTEPQVERVARAFDTPLLYNYAPGGRSPLLPFARLRELGFAIILLPVDTLLVAVQAIRAFLAQAKARDDVRALADLYMPFGEFNELIGVTAQLALAERYRGDDRSAT